MTTIRTSRTLDEYAAAMGLQTLSREIELNSEDVERRLVEVRWQHPEETPDQQYARAVARELWFNYPHLRQVAPPEPQQIPPPPELQQIPPPPPEVQTVILRMTNWQKLALYFWLLVTLLLLGVIAARGQGGQGPMIEALDEGIRVRFFAAGVMRWNCIGAGITCTWNPVTRRVDLTVAGGAAAHNLLSATHLDTVAAAPVRGDLIVGSAVPDWQRFARGAAGEVFCMNLAGTDPIWAAILAVLHGGTGTNIAFTPGSVLFAGAGGVYSQDNANFFWDNVNKQLGISVAAPAVSLDVASAASDIAQFTGGTGAGVARLVINTNAGTLNVGFRLQIVGVSKWSNAVYQQAGTGANYDYSLWNEQTNSAGIFIDGNTNFVGLGTLLPTSRLQVVGLPIYANNAAAIAGGLTAGAFYRTNADPDPVCVVH